MMKAKIIKINRLKTLRHHRLEAGDLQRSKYLISTYFLSLCPR